MRRLISTAVSGLLTVLLSGIAEPLAAQQQTPTPAPPAPAQSAPPPQNSTMPPIELPENPGRSTAPAETPSPSASSVPQKQQPTEPSGTAVAPAIQASGGAASKPAGVAIAPPKQRQVRSWLIRFGFIAGAGVALGTVAALSAASPGRVPGSGH
jgi:hypothetical protein